jgi:hypothetical protein
MRCRWAPIALIGLIGGCSSDSASSNTAAATTLPAATSTSAGATATTTAATVAPTTTPAPAAITPEVVCATPIGGGAVYFAYTNSSTAPVTIDAGSGNVVSGGIQDDVPLLPTVFAPGRVSPAFWVYPESEATWTVTGPDGTTRTATAGDSTPECSDALLSPTVPDSRAPDLTITYTAVPASANPPQQLDLVATVAGVPTSVCASGLQPQPPEIWTDDSNGGSVIVGDSVSRTLPFEQVTDPETNQSQLVAQTIVSGLVVDVCGANGAVTKSWPSGAGFDRLRTGELVCFRAADGAITMDVHDLDVPATCVGSPLPATGGQRIRTLP